ncbi:MAG: flippase-like domain-containing protein [Anaerolineae bacterium]|nr:flippase-like domain-containing protein [Anaerolineae bacterium]
MKRWLFVGLGLVVSAVFLYLGFRGLNLDDLVDALRGLHVGWLAVATVVYFGAAYLITWRWYYLLRPVQDVPVKRLFSLVIIGYMGNNIYPFRIGEVIRAYILRQREGTNIPATLTTILVERVFDGLTLLGFVFGALLFVQFEEPLLRDGIVLLTALFVAAIIVFFVLALRPEFTRRLYTGLLTRFAPAPLRARLIALADELMDGLAALRSARDLALTIGASIASWTVEASTYWLVLLAFNFEVSFFALGLCMGLGNLATILPTTPGYVGTFHGVVTLVLLGFGVAQADAAAYAVVMHAVLWAPITLAGAILLARAGLRLKDFAQAEQAVAAATQGE